MMLGETNPQASLPGSIRGDMSIQVGRNICHGSDSVESAKAEIALWFKKEELVNWNSASYCWIYEEPEEGVAPAKAGSAAAPAAEEEDDDDVDLFGSDDEEEDAEAERIKAERIAAYNQRKAAKEEKGKVIAKSNIILDIKPWDDETPLEKLEESIRSITMDGLLWGTGKFVAIGYGIKKLQITCVIEDDKVMMDDLEEQITGFEDYVQSMDIVAFNKI